jgi:hypothetical protein
VFVLFIVRTAIWIGGFVARSQLLVLRLDVRRQYGVTVVKIKMCPWCLTERLAMRTDRGVEVQLHSFLTSALDGGEWLVSRPGRITPEKGIPGTHWIGGWVGPRAGLDFCVEEKNTALPGSEPLLSRS